MLQPASFASPMRSAEFLYTNWNRGWEWAAGGELGYARWRSNTAGWARRQRRPPSGPHRPLAPTYRADCPRLASLNPRLHAHCRFWTTQTRTVLSMAASLIAPPHTTADWSAGPGSCLVPGPISRR